MRTFLFMFLMLAVAAGGFFAYMQSQAHTPRTGGLNTSVGPIEGHTIDPDAGSVGSAGPGSRPWVKVYDKERRLSHRFRAGEYAPERNGRIEVKKPEAEFFQYVKDSADPTGNTFRTQRIQLVGETGEVEVQQGPQASADKGLDKGASGPPKRGLLNDVTIKIFERTKDPEPSIQIKTPNVSFDNEAFEIKTRSYEKPDGTVVPADQVPIEATGNYAFSGRGLTLNWNDVDGRLERLEIAHGDYLQIKNPSALGKGDSPFGGGKPNDATSKPTASALSEGPLLSEVGEVVQLAAKDKPAGLPKTQPARPKRPRQPPYRASFDRDVRVSEGEMNVSETMLASADVMYLDFLSGSSEKSTTKPATKPVADPPKNPATQPVTPDGGGKAPAATQPATKPIIVRWAGKLRIVPMDTPGEIATPLKPGESVLRLAGTNSPVRLSRDNNLVDCTAADYFSSDGSVQVRGSERHGPVILRQLPDPAQSAEQARQATVITESLNYAGNQKVAVLNGKSSATIVMPQQSTTKPAAGENPATQPAQVMTVTWLKEGKLLFKDGINGQMTMDRADFSGDVDVKHPQLALKSQQLGMQFAETLKPATQPSDSRSAQLDVKEVVATTNVWADLIDSAGNKQTVTTDRLTVVTAKDADGKPYPQLITAAGNAHAFDEKQDLRAGNVELTLAPAAKADAAATKPAEPAKPGEIDSAAVELKHMRAWGGVIVRNAEGATATGDQMAVDTSSGQPLATLIGAPLATVTDPKGSTIAGPQIDIDPSRQWAKVTGRGSIRAVQVEEEKADTKPAAVAQAAKPPKFLDVIWETQAEMDGKSDRIRVEGPVVVSSTDEDGTINRATGRRAVIELTAKPAPATKPASAAPMQPTAVQLATTRPSKPATQPSALPGLAGTGGMDFLKDKTVSAVNLDDDAAVNSTLADATGVLRQFELKSQKIRYEAGPPAGVAASTTRPASPLALGGGGSGRLIVPGAGQMIYRDHRPASQPSTQPAGAAQGGGSPGQARGATAFQWQDSLVYEQLDRKAVLSGSVVIVHQPDNRAETPVRVSSDRATALFDAKPKAQPVNGAAPADPATAMQLKWLTLAGNLIVNRAGAEMTADSMNYDPATGWMTAIGTPRQAAAYTDATGQQTIFADQVLWNAQTWATRFVNIRGRTGSDRPKR